MYNPDLLIKLFDLKNTKKVPDEIRSSCPFAKQLHDSGKDSHPSFGINLDTGKWHCFVCADRGTKGFNIIMLAERLKVKLPDELILATKPTLNRIRKNGSPKIPQHLISLLTANPIFAWKYLKKRGISKEAVKNSRVGRHKALGTLYFPDIDYKGILRGWVERNEKWNYRYKVGEGCNRRYLLFGLRKPMKTCYLVEGPTDKLKLDTFGYSSVATCGNMIFPEQAERILSLVKQLIIIPDRDTGAQRWIKDAIKLFKGKIKMWGIEISKGKDVGDSKYKKKHWLKDLKQHEFIY